MHRRSSQLSIAAVALVLGLLAVVQLRSQSGGSALDARSAQELTVLVANLNARNDGLRTEVARLEQELSSLLADQSRGQTSVGQLRTDLARVRAWAGLDPVVGSGIRITISGPIAADGIADLLNELRNAGAEAIAIADVRVVAGTIVGGETGAVSVDDTALGDPFEVSAIGRPETLTGSLTRVGGIVAQLGATFPGAVVTVTPIDRLVLPATVRDLRPAHGAPSL
jgi:uncharacterized protein YlxW (UPF0749 family)